VAGPAVSFLVFRRRQGMWRVFLRGAMFIGVLEMLTNTLTPTSLTEPATMVVPLASSEAQTVQSLGFAIYRALDWGLDESEERELSPQLERLIDLMANNDSEDSGCGAADEGYGGPEEEEEAEGVPRSVRTFAQAMRLCAARLTDPRGAQAHYQAVCRALFVETLELRAFLARVREAKEVSGAWGRPRRVRGAKEVPAPKVAPSILRNHRKAQRLAWSFGWENPPLGPVTTQPPSPAPYRWRDLLTAEQVQARRLGLLPKATKQGLASAGFGSLPCILNACSGDTKSTSCINLSVTDAGGSAQRPRPRVLLKAPTLAEMEEMNTSEEEESPCGEVTLKRDRSFSEHDLAQLRSEVASGLQLATQPPAGTEPPRPRAGSARVWRPGSRDQGTCATSVSDPSHPLLSNRGSSGDRPEASMTPDAKHLWLEFSHPVESLALTVEEVMDVRRVLVKAEMEKFLQNKELFSSLKKGKICCCCRAKFPLFSWPPTCLFLYPECVCGDAWFMPPPSVLQMKMPSKKFGHIPVYTLGFESPQRVSAAKTAPIQRRDIFQSLQGPQWQSVEEAFPHIYAHGCVLKDVCSECTSFVADVVRSSRKSMDVLNTTPRRSRQTQSLYIPNTRTLDFK
uniref:KIND domain-containing protein n=1 Tax=Colobus angolensis palliatus TaxID=336983 RepID=A0A2K5JUH9_COLAP